MRSSGGGVPGGAVHRERKLRGGGKKRSAKGKRFARGVREQATKCIAAPDRAIFPDLCVNVGQTTRFILRAHPPHTRWARRPHCLDAVRGGLTPGLAPARSRAPQMHEMGLSNEDTQAQEHCRAFQRGLDRPAALMLFRDGPELPGARRACISRVFGRKTWRSARRPTPNFAMLEAVAQPAQNTTRGCCMRLHAAQRFSNSKTTRQTLHAISGKPGENAVLHSRAPGERAPWPWRRRRPHL